MANPRRLVIEYDDGSQKAISFREVDRQTQSELAKYGLCPHPDGVRHSKYYVLLKWQDQWQEVLGMDSEIAELLRYYVIERIEYSGRLALEIGGDFPGVECFTIGRKPRELVSVLIIDKLFFIVDIHSFQ